MNERNSKGRGMKEYRYLYHKKVGELKTNVIPMCCTKFPYEPSDYKVFSEYIHDRLYYEPYVPNDDDIDEMAEMIKGEYENISDMTPDMRHILFRYNRRKHNLDACREIAGVDLVYHMRMPSNMKPWTIADNFLTHARLYHEEGNLASIERKFCNLADRYISDKIESDRTYYMGSIDVIQMLVQLSIAYANLKDVERAMDIWREVKPCLGDVSGQRRELTFFWRDVINLCKQLKLPYEKYLDKMLSSEKRFISSISIKEDSTVYLDNVETRFSAYYYMHILADAKKIIETIYEENKKKEAPSENNIQVYYHVTSIANIDSIYENGLIPQQGFLSELALESNPGIYMFKTLEEVSYAMKHWFGDNIQSVYDLEDLLLLKIELSDDKIIELLEERFGWEVISYRTIPPEDISIIDFPAATKIQ
jgi:hypothetical protein